jgi:hypothetical protein
VGELVSIGFDPNEKVQTTVVKPTAELVTTVEALTSPHFVTLDDMKDDDDDDDVADAVDDVMNKGVDVMTSDSPSKVCMHACMHVCMYVCMYGLCGLVQCLCM